MADRMRLAVLLAGTALLAEIAAADSADPTRPPPGFTEQPGAVALAPQSAPLVVSSLFLMGANPYAVVDDQIVRPGDPLADGKVSKIDASGVWITIPGGGSVPGVGKTRTGVRLLKWLPDIRKTPAKSPPSARMEKK